MSFEGVDEYICKNGHYWNRDVYFSFIEEEPICPICKSKAKYWHLIDQTNGEGNPGRKKVKKKISGVCSCCGKEHACEITYEPNKKDWKLIK